MLDGKKLLALLRKPGQFTLFHLVDMKRTTDDLRGSVQRLPSQRVPETAATRSLAKERRSLTA